VVVSAAGRKSTTKCTFGLLAYCILKLEHMFNSKERVYRFSLYASLRTASIFKVEVCWESKQQAEKVDKLQPDYTVSHPKRWYCIFEFVDSLQGLQLSNLLWAKSLNYFAKQCSVSCLLFHDLFSLFMNVYRLTLSYFPSELGFLPIKHDAWNCLLLCCVPCNWLINSKR
jgi:hypothetical protein